MTESERKQAMRDCPILSDYLATALQDLQCTEMDESCEEEREERDSGTIFDCPDETFLRAQRDCTAFMESQKRWIERATDLEPGEDGLRYGTRGFDMGRIGSTFYLSRVGHGVAFTDDGDDMALQILGDYSRSHRCEGLYFGDDGKAYWG